MVTNETMVTNERRMQPARGRFARFDLDRQIASTFPAHWKVGPAPVFWASQPLEPAEWLALLILKAGDVESNPGPQTRNDIVCVIDRRIRWWWKNSSMYIYRCIMFFYKVCLYLQVYHVVLLAMFISTYASGSYIWNVYIYRYIMYIYMVCIYLQMHYILLNGCIQMHHVLLYDMLTYLCLHIHHVLH